MNSNLDDFLFDWTKCEEKILEIHLERSTQWISTHVLFWIFFPTILWEMTTCNLHQWIMNVPLLLLEAEKKNYKSTLKHRSFWTALGVLSSNQKQPGSNGMISMSTQDSVQTGGAIRWVGSTLCRGQTEGSAACAIATMLLDGREFYTRRVGWKWEGDKKVGGLPSLKLKH